MSYFDDIEIILASLSEEERAIIVERFGIDLKQSEQMLQSQHAFNETRKRIRKIERKALSKLRPNQVHTEPEGPECTFCGVTENEVKTMAKHESGFNICNEYIELCMQVIREKNKE